PVFSRFFSMGLQGPYTIRAEGYGEVPDIDLALTFDTSGSIDDQTPVSYVHYFWDKSANRVRIRIAGNGNGTGIMREIMNAAADGTGLNANWIQNLGTDDGRHSLRYHPEIRNQSSNVGPPGNHFSVSMSRYNNYNASSSHYTHILVNSNTDGNNRAVY